MWVVQWMRGERGVQGGLRGERVVCQWRCELVLMAGRWLDDGWSVLVGGGPGLIMDDGVLDADWLIRLTYGPPARPARRHSESL